MNEKLRKTLFWLCVAVFVVCAALLARHFLEAAENRRLQEQLAALVTETPAPTPSATPEPTPSPEVTPEPTEPPPPEVLAKYAGLVAENPDVIGWLKLDDSKIDNPVMWTPAEPDKYLHTDFYGNESAYGTLYLDEDCDIWASDNLIIFGHHMRDGTMFGDLDEYRDRSYWESHPVVRFDTIYDEREYEVVAAFYSRVFYAHEDDYRYYNFIDAETEAEFDEFVAFLEENQLYDTGLDLAWGDRLLTLSTCAYHVENGRFAVVCRLVTEDEPEPSPEAAPSPSAEPSAGTAERLLIDPEAAPLAAAPEEAEAVPLAAAPEEAGAAARGAMGDALVLPALCLLLAGLGLLSLSRRRDG